MTIQDVLKKIKEEINQEMIKEHGTLQNYYNHLYKSLASVFLNKVKAYKNNQIENSNCDLLLDETFRLNFFLPRELNVQDLQEEIEISLYSYDYIKLLEIKKDPHNENKYRITYLIQYERDILKLLEDL